MRNGDDGPVVKHASAECSLQHSICFDIDSGGRFVEDEDVGRSEQGTGKGDELALSRREVGAAFVDGGVKLAGHGGDVVLETSVICCSQLDGRPRDMLMVTYLVHSRVQYRREHALGQGCRAQCLRRALHLVE